ncbi:carbohydrate ABC transporter permease [Curtobacterium sp. VKM Ac-1376]|uniref:carbohydrate ABC transporter permease n=1 Tax=Curtobacterium sp. VKM Ac-1376 TaxID=123312 RepID=UPI00188C3C33|nr:carbohydrate ABC transporter permease [Curtobacterium sp. VKM Ac-1376]MBF4613607.1 carbohydrate ABC transporter permease [Curtobacterium sp. VKM Ac-1376]
MSNTAPSPRSRRLRRALRPGNVAFWIVLVALTVAFLLPLAFMVSTSFKSATEANALEFSLLPQHPTLDAYREILGSGQIPVLRWLLNSVVTALLHSAFVVVLATTAAYALARIEFPLKRTLFALIVLTMFVPGVIFLIPHFQIVNELGWLNTYASLVVPSAAGAFGVFFLRQFFVGISRSIEEAALLDGCNQWSIFIKIMVPLAKPAIATLAVLAFLASWNDFLWPVFVLFSSDMMTLPAGLAQLQSDNATRYDLLMAGGVVASLPVLAVYVVSQRWIIAGVSAGGVKG